MTGLCGWFSSEPPALPLADMAVAFGGAMQLRTGKHGMGAAAVSATLGGAVSEATLYARDGLLIAHWGERVEELARLWRLHGAQACAALSGHFAFAILDEHRGEALLAVDRCATRPLFYQAVGRSLVFASSMEALARHPGTGRELDPQAVFDYLYLHATHGPRTMHSGARRLGPGECLHLRGGRVERSHYWRIRYTEHAAQAAPQAALVEALSCAVDAGPQEHRHPTGLLLAGGAASALLAAQLVQTKHGADAPLHTYMVGFGDGAGAMLKRARATASRLGSLHRDTVIDADDVADAMAPLALATDAPCGEPGAVAMLFAARMAREDGVRRLACAMGAAQLFGRGRHGPLARAGRYERLPGALRQLLIEPLLFGAGARLPGGFERLRERIELSMAAPPERLRRANALLAHGVSSVFEPGFLPQVDPEAPAALQERTWWLAQARAGVNRAADLELQGELPCRLLPAFGAACAANGVNPAFPYLHDAVVAVSARLAPRHKTLSGGRRLFALALRELGCRLAVPYEAAPAPLPFGAWLLADARLRALACDSLAAFSRRGIVRREFIDLLLARRLPQDPALHGQLVWRLMMLEAWCARRRQGGARALEEPTREAVLPA